MKPIKWNNSDNIYSATIERRKTVVLEQEKGFKPQIINDDNIVLREWPGHFLEFEEAEEWVLINIIGLEEADDKEISQRKLLEILDDCTSRIEGTVHHSHLLRLANIRKWIFERNVLPTTPVTIRGTYQNYLFQWSDDTPNQFSADTPHGKAIIIEEKPAKSPFRVNPPTKHKGMIEHSSGAIYESPGHSIEFLDIENWLRQTLSELDDPTVSEYNLGNIHFTLEICKRSLPLDVDPLTITRMDLLKDEMDLILM
ncbi:MAG TPA: hypothetical protein PLU50_12275 [Pseudobdellovibrionaceae bacterium]|nr:hypothetical protein [Pseudobdellovibrionaceae bacterium]